MEVRVEGRRPVLAAVKSGRARRVYVAEGARSRIVEEILSAAEAGAIEVERVPRTRLDVWSQTGSHQGVMADAASVETSDWIGRVDAARSEGRVPFVVAFEGVQDPHNLGALIRSAAAFAADVAIIPKDRAVSVTSSVEKTAAGGLEYVPVASVSSFQAAAEQASAAGLWVVALGDEGASTLEACRLLSEPIFLVIGAEGRGVSRTIRNLADEFVSISTNPEFPTLNASVAGAIAMHAVSTSRLT